jgi:hypothetical protein
MENKMTSKVDVVRAYHEEAYSNPPTSIIEANEKYIADDFQGLDKEGNVTTNKAAFLGMTKLLINAFEDFRGVVHNLREEEGNVRLTFHLEGTQTGDFDLSAMGLGVIPASGKRIETGESETIFMVEGDQIVGTRPISGGMEEILLALGVNSPAA